MKPSDRLHKTIPRALAAPDANANQTFQLADIDATSKLPSRAKSAALNMELLAILIK
jgi:hypothetical protein